MFIFSASERERAGDLLRACESAAEEALTAFWNDVLDREEAVLGGKPTSRPKLYLIRTPSGTGKSRAAAQLAAFAAVDRSGAATAPDGVGEAVRPLVYLCPDSRKVDVARKRVSEQLDVLGVDGAEKGSLVGNMLGKRLAGCEYPEQVGQLAAAGLPTNALCKSGDWECPARKRCGFIRQRTRQHQDPWGRGRWEHHRLLDFEDGLTPDEPEAVTFAPVRAVSHKRLPPAIRDCRGVVIDETPLLELLGHGYVPVHALETSIAYAGTDESEDPQVTGRDKLASVVADAFRKGNDPLATVLALSGDKKAAVAEIEGAMEVCRPLSAAAISTSDDKRRLKSRTARARRDHARAEWRLWHVFRSILMDGGERLGDDARIAYRAPHGANPWIDIGWIRPFAWPDRPVAVLDAEGDPDLYRAVFSETHDVVDVPAPEGCEGWSEATFVTGLGGTRSTLYPPAGVSSYTDSNGLERDPWKEAERRRAKLAHAVWTASGGPEGDNAPEACVVAPEPPQGFAEEAFADPAELADQSEVSRFGKLRMSAPTTATRSVVCGRVELPEDAVRRMAMAVRSGDMVGAFPPHGGEVGWIQRDVRLPLRDGSVASVVCRMPQDPVEESVLRSRREAELSRAANRVSPLRRAAEGQATSTVIIGKVPPTGVVFDRVVRLEDYLNPDPYRSAALKGSGCVSARSLVELGAIEAKKLASANRRLKEAGFSGDTCPSGWIPVKLQTGKKGRPPYLWVLSDVEDKVGSVLDHIERFGPEEAVPSASHEQALSAMQTAHEPCEDDWAAQGQVDPPSAAASL
ncbi:hypothetical protein CKO28_13345 [Rhodovibrio sodomensis]|uniref:Uncharacterized protein n=1 Tax=Rhodovibrio sodomensis TaxID=1088 RepID=A0ABS1DFY6_9PROT|nr:hypothetical protein [Rhodovibrio sodomensis]MBK1669017.1 hypothetical protein [Rhodovibrio sodomensis]